MNVLNNNRGSAIIMVMLVGVGTLAIIGYSMQKFTIGKKQAKSMELRQDGAFIWGQVKGLMSSKQTCLSTFKSLPPAGLTVLQNGDATQLVEVDNLRMADAAKTVIFSKNKKMDNRIELQRMFLKEITSPAGNTSVEIEKAYNGVTPQVNLSSIIRTGVLVTELKNLRTDQITKKEINMRFNFQNNVLIDCYGIEKKDEIISAAIGDQCKVHGGTFNPLLNQCEYGDGKQLFSMTDNNSVYCQMDKDRVQTQGYANPSFCPNSYQWGGCIWNGTVLASQESTIYKDGKLAGGVHAYITRNRVDFNEGALVASLLLGGTMGASIVAAFTGLMNWCEKKEYYICAKCIDGKIVLNEYSYRYQYKKKKIKCKWRTAYNNGCG